ncbi:MAG: glycosyltransferase family 2 protein [Candidatus Pollutiaquabacter aromativorans]
MFVSGFTFIRNAVRFDYPIVEAIRSILPLCDEVVVAVGRSDDNTRELIEQIGSDKIRILDTVWDDALREGGRVLAEETNKAFAAVNPKADWCFYIQGDEVIHERDHPAIRQAMLQWKDDPRVEGLLFRYLHFYGSYDYVGDSTRWYRREVRIVRRDPAIVSFRDAQGFRKSGRPLWVKPVDAVVHHYGWVKPPEQQQAKQRSFHALWHSDEWVRDRVGTNSTFDYSGIDSLAPFKGSHPAVIRERIQRQNWTFDFDPSRRRLSIKSKFKLWVEHLTGWLPGEYRNYRLLR